MPAKKSLRVLIGHKTRAVLFLFASACATATVDRPVDIVDDDDTKGSAERTAESTGALTADEIHNSAIVLLAHDHRLTSQELSAATAGGFSGIGIDLTVDGLDWQAGTRVSNTPAQTSATFNSKLTQLNSIVASSGGSIRLARTVQDIADAKAVGGVAVVVGSEGVNQIPGGWPLGASLNVRTAVQSLFTSGWRKTQIWYPAGYGGTGSDQTFFSIGGAPTTAGGQLIAELNRTGVLIDTQHIQGTTTFISLLNANNAPLLDSHEYPELPGSGTTSAAMVQIAESGGGYGVIGLMNIANLYPSYPSVSATTVARDLRIIANTVGADHVALGGDYMPPDDISKVGGAPDWAYAPASVADFRTLTAAMLGANCPNPGGGMVTCFTETEARKVLGLNLMNLYERAWDPTHGHAGGLARFYTCTDGSASDECIRAASHNGQGDFNHRPVTCLSAAAAGPVGLQLTYVAGHWKYWSISATLNSCVDGSLLAVSFADGSANGELAMCPNSGGPALCAGARLNGGSGASDTRSINCLANATSGPIGLQLAYTASAFKFYNISGGLQACQSTSALSARWGASANATARVRLCDDRASDSSDANADSVCVTAATSVGSGTSSVRALNCYSSVPSAGSHGAVGLELFYDAGRWKYYDVNAVARNCVHGSVMVAHW